MNTADLILSVLLITGLAVFIYYIFKDRVNDDDNKRMNQSIEAICEEFKKAVKEIVNMDMNALNLNKRDLENRKVLKRSLSNAIRMCSQGDMNSKTIVLSRVKYTLLNAMKIDEDTIDMIIPFNHPERLSALDKFEIMMYLQKRNRQIGMFKGICGHTGLDRLCRDTDGYYYAVTDEDIHKAYLMSPQALSFDDKLNILAQRIYEETYGLSVADLLIMEDTSIDGISGGVSGITGNNYLYLDDDIQSGCHDRARTYDSVWVIYEGKPIHLKFLSFGSETVIRRICKNLAEYGRTGHLTSSEGAVKTHLADGKCRVTVFRPDNASQWAFFVRKYAGTMSCNLEDLIVGPGSGYPIEAIRWAVQGCVNLFFSGDQNSGKTTYTRAAVREIDRRRPVRTLEADFELFLNNTYPDKNILGTRPGDRLPFPKLIEILKSSDAHTILFGETASLEQARHLIDLLLAGTRHVITTGHWPTSDDLIAYFVHALGASGSSGASSTESMVAGLIHLDVHCVKDNDGGRYIERITEIIPYEHDDGDYVSNFKEAKGIREIKDINDAKGIKENLEDIARCLNRLVRRKAYYTRNIVVCENGVYRMINPFSERLSKIILGNLPPDKRQEFLNFNIVPGSISKDKAVEV